MKWLKYILKGLLTVVMIALFAIVVTSVSLIYNFQKPTPFRGNDIFNPYRNISKEHCWKRANFHTHTRVEGILNECDHTAEQTLDYYEKFDYDIVTFSNHNELTVHPTEPSQSLNLYEHGYNICKFHKLVFGCTKVNRFDHLLPIFTSQKQFQIDMLSRESDIVVLNHPLRTHAMTERDFERLEGYRIVELDSGKSTENSYWDTALSAGIYSFALANDDLHYPDRTRAIAIRSNFLCTPSGSYQDVCRTLNEGGYYSMRVPDYGGGDWQAKIEGNSTLPQIKSIGVSGQSPYIALTEVADSIVVTGQNHTTLAVAYSADSLGYTMLPKDSYSRFTAYFGGGEVIYSNPFARYDAESQSTPFRTTHSVNIALTALYNAIIALIAALLIYKIVKLW